MAHASQAVLPVAMFAYSVRELCNDILRAAESLLYHYSIRLK